MHDPVKPAPNSDGLSSDVNEGGVKVFFAYRMRSAGLFSSMMLFLAAPAEAHHPGGGGNTGSGGPINTISADTLSEGLIAASIRYEFIRLGQL